MQDLYGIQTQLVITTNQEEERHSESVLPTSGSSPPPNTNNQNLKMEQISTEAKDSNQISTKDLPVNMTTDQIKTEVDPTEYQCKICSMSFTTPSNMHRHIRVAHEDSSSRTDGGSSSDDSGKRKRLKRRHEFKGLKRTNDDDFRGKPKIPRSALTCPVCKREDFASVNVLEMHLEESHPEYQIKCIECNLGFKNHRVLNLHRFMVHQIPNATGEIIGYKDLAFVDFSSQKFPIIAQKMCENAIYRSSSEFQCDRCVRNFPCLSALEMHKQTCLRPNQIVTSSSDEENDEEYKRRKSFFAGLNLLTKKETDDESDSKPIIPTTIHPDGKDLADIQSILSVTNAGGLLNQYVPKGSSQEGGPEEEQDMFAAEFRKMKLRGEFPCRLCTAVFPNLRALKGHNRAHLTGNGANGGVPYRCNMCPHSSTDKAALIRHMRTHNGDRPYECALCNYAFTTKANCERHLRNRHRKVTREDVKRSIIYHPSEDPTNDENLSKTPTKTQEYPKRALFPPVTPETIPPPAVGPVSLQIPDFRTVISKLQDMKPKEAYPKLSSALNLSIDDKPKIQVKNFAQLAIPELINTPAKSDSESESEYPAYEPPIDLSCDVLDLSKKKRDTEEPPAEPQDLTKKSPNLFEKTQFLLAQQLLKRSNPNFYPNIYQTPRNPPFINPYFLQPHPFLTPTASPQDLIDMKERIQKEILRGLQLSSGGGLVNTPIPNFEPQPPQTKEEPPKNPTILSHTPNSVKMVIKNGVLMPKQKQRRYRTERPFSCEHCSARFTLRSNMERHIKQQHPQFWSQRQRANLTQPQPGRKPSTIQPPQITLSNPMPINQNPNLLISEQVKFAILAQQLKQFQQPPADDDDPEDPEALVIDENSQEPPPPEPKKSLEQKMIELRLIRQKILLRQQEEQQEKAREEATKNEDLVPVSKLLDNAAVQIPFREYFMRENNELPGEENGEFTGPGSEEDEEGLVASGSTSEGNISGSDGNRSETELTHKNAQIASNDLQTFANNNQGPEGVPVKKKSAYSLAPNRVTCPYCHRKFPWSSSLRRHILTHTGQKPFKCSHCPLLFTTKSNCDRHLLRKHGNVSQTPNQPPVEIPLQNNYMMRNVPERPFKCSNCPSSTFSTMNNLKKHMTCKHQDGSSYESSPSDDEDVKVEIQNSDLPFKCHLCDSSYCDRQMALDHIKDLHGSEYELLMSKGALETNNNQSEHGFSEDDQQVRGKFPDYANRKVMCAFCMRRFWSAEDLRRHMRTHTGERPFSCDVCRRRFTLKHSMLRHRKKHNNMHVSDEDDMKNNNCKYSEVSEQRSDLISNLLGLRDSSIIDQVLRSSADDAAKILGVNKTE